MTPSRPASTSTRPRPRRKPPENILGEPAAVEIGDAEAALGRRGHRVDATYRTPRHNHNAIELHAVDGRLGGRRSLTVHDATQMLT